LKGDVDLLRIDEIDSSCNLKTEFHTEALSRAEHEQKRKNEMFFEDSHSMVKFAQTFF
jgi:hypothetical protein